MATLPGERHILPKVSMRRRGQKGRETPQLRAIQLQRRVLRKEPDVSNRTKELCMESKNTAVFGIYATPATAENGVDHLLTLGFKNEAISVLMPDDDTTRAFAHQKNTKAPEGTTAGVTTGGVIGGTLGVLAGLGALAIPGIGPLLAAGPIVAALAGVGAGGVVGGLIGALVGMGIPEYEAKRYEGAVRNGGTLLSVHCDTSDQISLAKQGLRDTGAHDIASTGEEGAAKERHHAA
jgi:hypothetical protein